jgi:TRAP-type mannitol/chloroaromatic compound transport system permease small subunit
MSGVRSVLRSIDTINERVGKAASYIILAILAIAALEVVLRYVFNRPTIWAWDVNIMLMGAVTVMSGGCILLTGGHPSVDIILRILSPRARAMVELVTFLLFFLGIGVLLWQSGIDAWNSILTREKLNTYFAPPVYPLKILWPIGVFLLLLQGVAKAVRDIMIFLSR